MEGFSGVVFVLVFIAFSILEGIGRKRKAQEQKGGVDGASKPRTRETRPPLEAGSPGSTPAGASGTGSSVEARKTPGGKGTAEGSEGLIPKDVWEEILGLARGTPPAPRRPEPSPDRDAAPVARREGETLEEVLPVEARSLEKLHVEHHRVSERADMATSPTGVEASKGLGPRGGAQGKGRRAGAQGAGPVTAPAQRRRMAGCRLRRDLFGRGAPEDLRRAVILSEVLGPPVAMRDQPGEG